MCPTPARRVTLLTCIWRKSAAAVAVTGLSEGCGAFFGISGSVFIEVSIDRQMQKTNRSWEETLPTAGAVSVTISLEEESSDGASH